MKKPITNPVLQTWDALNEFIRKADEKSCQKLLEEELKGRARRVFLLRIHSRLNKLRADRERDDLRQRAS